jgi:hypothetical protein
MLTPPALILTIFSLAFVAVVFSIVSFGICFYMILDIAICQAREEAFRNSVEEKERRKRVREENKLRREIEAFEFL